jgi:hypothetical protein
LQTGALETLVDFTNEIFFDAIGFDYRKSSFRCHADVLPDYLL